MPPRIVRCPPNPGEVAESYVMDGMIGAELEAYEEHLLVCARCQDAVEQADQFVRAMRIAASRLRQTHRAQERRAPN